MLITQPFIPSPQVASQLSQSSGRTSRTGLVPGKRVHAHRTLTLWTATLRPSVASTLLAPSFHPAHLACLPTRYTLRACTLHLAPCTLLPSHLLLLSSVCWLRVLLKCARACARCVVRLISRPIHTKTVQYAVAVPLICPQPGLLTTAHESTHTPSHIHHAHTASKWPDSLGRPLKNSRNGLGFL